MVVRGIFRKISIDIKTSIAPPGFLWLLQRVGLDFGWTWYLLPLLEVLHMHALPSVKVSVTLFKEIHWPIQPFFTDLSSGEAGLIISAAMSMIELEYGIRQSAEMMNQMTSVDRVIEYGRLPSEAPLESSKGNSCIV